MTELPDPLTPADCNLRNLSWMRLDISRMLDSDLFALATGDEFKAAFSLIGKSWSQLPAGSLPDDDCILAHLSGAGRKWKRVKAVALRGWIKCSDGRLYHSVVAEKALEAMGFVEVREESDEVRQTRQQRHREHRAAMFEQLRAHGIVPKYDTKTSELARLIETLPVTGDVASDVTGGASETPETSPATANTIRRRDGTVNVAVNDDVETHKPKAPVDNSNGVAGETPESSSLSVDAMSTSLTRWELDRGKKPRFDADHPKLQAWVAKGVTGPQLRRAYDLAVAERDAQSDATAINAGFLDAFVLKVNAPPRASPTPLRGMTDVQLCDEAKRLGFELSPSWSKDECLARIEQKRGEHKQERAA
ncbi:Protein of unknown function [Burkholderia sp. GAS332]|nr:Protein of unknown function [Burkholderia sp. GAS332]